MLVCGDRLGQDRKIPKFREVLNQVLVFSNPGLGCAGSGSPGDAAAACSVLVFFLGAAGFFSALALRLGAISLSLAVQPEAAVLNSRAMCFR